MKFKIEAEAGSARLVALFPWIAELPTGVHYCEGISTNGGVEHDCKNYAKFLYVNLDGTYNVFCRTHLDSFRLTAESSGNNDYAEEEKRCQRWFKRNMKEVQLELVHE